MDTITDQRTDEPSHSSASGYGALEEIQSRTQTNPLSKRHTTLENFTADLTKSLKRVIFSKNSKRYDDVFVLLLRWEEDDLGTESEIDILDEVFRDTYHYKTRRELIPSHDAENTLEKIITDFRQDHGKPHNLLILYYGGHGQANLRDNAEQTIWHAKRKGGPNLNWSYLQPRLVASQSDVLFILDCCYASSAGTRDRRRGSKEVMAASSMEDVAYGVGAKSYTHNLVEELRQCARMPLTTTILNGRMVNRRGHNLLNYTPHHFSLVDDDAPSIELSPLETSSSGPPSPPLTATGSVTSVSSLSVDDLELLDRDRVLLSINLKDWTIPPRNEEWVEWLRGRIPKNIELISAYFRPQGTRETMISNIGRADDSRPLAEGLLKVPDYDRTKRVEQLIIHTEGAWSSHSTLLLISIPLPLWTFLPHNAAYSFVGFIKSRNKVLDGALTRENSVRQIQDVVEKMDRQQQRWWYKSSITLTIVAILPTSWSLLHSKGFDISLLSPVLMLLVIIIAVDWLFWQEDLLKPWLANDLSGSIAACTAFNNRSYD